MKRTTLLFLVLLTLLTFFKLYQIQGGFVPDQPDERTYAEVAKNFHTSFYPNYDGVALFNSPPLFYYLSYLLSFVIPGYYLPLRVLSLLASFLLGWYLFYYLKKKHSVLVAGVTAAIFLVLPITVYFSRLGLLEMLVSLFAFLFVTAFEIAWKRSSLKWGVISGVSLGAGILTKYSLIPLAIIPFLYLGFWALRKLIQKNNLLFLIKPEARKKYLIFLVLFSLALVIALPILYLSYQANPIEFKNQFKYIFGLGGRPLNMNISVQYLLHLPQLITWTGISLLFLGLLGLKSKFTGYLPSLLSLAILTYSIVRIGLFETRYLVILAPFLMVLFGGGVEIIFEFISKVNGKIILPSLLISTLLLVTVLPASWFALRATHHTVVEEVGNYIKERNQANSWVVSNYWPSAFVNEVGYKTTWLTSEPSDGQAFHGLIGSKFESIETDSASVIINEGGWVIVEELFSKSLSSDDRRAKPIIYLKSHFKAEKVFEDKNPNWLHGKQTNRFSIYHVPKKTSI